MSCGYRVDHTGAYVATEARMLSQKQKGSSGSALTGQGVERPAVVKGPGIWGSVEGEDGDSVWGRRKESKGCSGEVQRRARTRRARV